MLITAAQLRAARGLLDWTRTDLAKAANISPETVKNIEHGTFRPQEQTADAIIKAFGAHDVVFTEDEGVRRKKELVRTFTGKDGFIEKLEHVYQVVKEDPVTMHLALSDNYAPSVAPEYIKSYAEKMRAVPGLKAKCLVWEGDYNFPFDYCEYRWLKRSHKWVMPFYIYGGYASFMVQTTPDFFVTVSIHSEFLVDNLKKQFELLWADAVVPTKKKGATI
jgi:DNA-binding XRE family transcriptional regulator